MEERKKTGRPSPFDESLGLTIKKSPRFPEPVWRILEQNQTKKVLNRMAIDENYCKVVQESADDVWVDGHKQLFDRMDRLGAEQKAKRLSSENKKTPPD